MNRVKPLLIVAVLVFAGPAFGQDATQRPPRDSDPIAALTAEFRALRAELSATAAASLRLQLLVARIQAQEQRIIYLDRLRSEAATRRSNAEQERNELAGRIRRVTDADMLKADPEQRRQLDIEIEHYKTQLAVAERHFQQMQVDENDAASAVAQEQGRWNDLNTRLDDLERSLSQR